MFSGSDRTTWQLVRRFFLVDNISGKPASSTTQGTGLGGTSNIADTVDSTRAKAIRYAQSMTIHIELQDGTSSGKIYPPFLEITYGVVKEQDSQTDKKVQVCGVSQYNTMQYNAMQYNAMQYSTVQYLLDDVSTEEAILTIGTGLQ